MQIGTCVYIDQFEQVPEKFACFLVRLGRPERLEFL